MATLDEIKFLLQDIQAQIPSIIAAQRRVNATEVHVVGGLSDISEQLGLLQAGEFRTGNGREPGDGFTGGRFGWPGFSYNNELWFLAGVDDDVLQVGLSLNDGKVYAGEGSTIIDINGVNIYEQTGDVNGQIRFFNTTGSLTEDTFGFITMYEDTHLRFAYHDAATGNTTSLRVDATNASAHVNSRFRVVYEPTGRLAASLSALSGQEGLTIYDVSDGVTDVAEIKKTHWSLKAVTATPAYVDGYGRLYLYDTGSVTELRLRIKDGAAERQLVLGSSDGTIEATDFININGIANQDTELRFREASTTQGKVWYDASEDNISIENEVAGGDVLAVLDGGTPETENFVVWDRTVSKAILSVPNDFGWIGASQTWTYVSATTFSVSATVDLAPVFRKGTKLRFVQSATTKYFIVASSVSVLSAGVYTVTVTIIATSDYTLANAAITANYYSHIENPPGWPDWFTWAPAYTANGGTNPTWTSVTTNYAKFRVLGTTVYILLSANGTTGTTAGSITRLEASPPVAIASTNTIAIVASIADGTAAVITGKGGAISTVGLFGQKIDNSAFGNGTNRQLVIQGFYYI